jgi:DNA-binding IclR family transcriptional regulator
MAVDRAQDNEQRSGLVQSVARAVRILRVLFVAREGKHLTELSNEVGLHKTTVLRLLRTMVAEGIVAQDQQTSHYRLHPLTWLALRSKFPADSSAKMAKHLLEELAQKTGATVMLLTPVASSRNMAAILWAMPERMIRIDPNVKSHAPMHCCAPGRCYLATLPENTLKSWLKQELPKVTQHTMVDPAELTTELALVRKRGYAVTREELILGAAGLSVPITDEAGEMAAALNLATPTHEMTDENIQQWLPLLKDAASKLPQILQALKTDECSV